MAQNYPIQVAPHIHLRPFQEADAPSISHHASDKRVWDQLSDRLPHPYTVADAQAFIAKTHGTQMCAVPGPRPPSYHHAGPATTTEADDEKATVPLPDPIPATLAIVVDGEAVGCIGLDLRPGVYRLSPALGYWLGAAHHGKGVMSAAAAAFVRWVWATFGWIRRIDGTAYGDNAASIAVMRKVGFVLEGVRRQGTVKNGVVRDEVILGFLRPERV